MMDNKAFPFINSYLNNGDFGARAMQSKNKSSKAGMSARWAYLNKRTNAEHQVQFFWSTKSCQYIPEDV